ncbi:hypothetical protein [Pseudomonas proteolytica]|uniref:hypothetical protein n=1 Tax=Pseudomonas proteolytica TaxID=219574 RepID=UPI001472DF2B|nr:hypothetical protein [Pseudomonas proteolytica]NMZ33992.1 hypothetical protein [Pseudomonas proteolytica]
MLVRNSIAHPKLDISIGVRKFYDGNMDALKTTIFAYGMKSAPYDVCKLGFMILSIWLGFHLISRRLTTWFFIQVKID